MPTPLRTPVVLLGLSALLGLPALACGGNEPEAPAEQRADTPAHAPTPNQASESPAAAPSEPESKPAAEPAPTPEAEPLPAPQTPMGGIRLETGWAYQLSTKKDPADAEALRAQAQVALASANAIAPAYVLERENFYLIMAGSFALESEAQANFALAKSALGQGGFVRSMREFCPGQRRDGEHLYSCVDVELPEEPDPDEVADPQLDGGLDGGLDGDGGEPEPFTYPEPSGPDPVAIAHPAAAQIMVIASNRGYTPDKAGVDRDAKFRTFIWRPALGALPEKGKLEVEEQGDESGESEGEAPAPAASLLEIHKRLLVSDGKQLWQLGVEQGDVKFPLCDCYSDDHATRKTLAKRLVELRARPYPGGEELTLIDVLDFPNQHASYCIEEREHVDHVIQIHAVAGARVMVVERNVQREGCELDGVEEDSRTQRVFELGGGTVSLDALEAELPYAAVKDARFDTSKAFVEELFGPRQTYAPTALKLTGVFPRYREFKGGMRLLLQYSVPGDGELGAWGTGFDSHVVTLKYPASSSLAPPESVLPLMTYVQREYNSWKVIGWSLHELGAPAAPQAP